MRLPYDEHNKSVCRQKILGDELDVYNKGQGSQENLMVEG